MQIIPLTKGKTTRVDDADITLTAQYKWTATEARPGSGKWYAKTTVNHKGIYLHRLLMGAGPREQVDHWNNDGLDNQRRNLRKCNNQQNNANKPKRKGRSKYKGVHWNAKQKIWVASIHVNYGTQFLGHFKDEESAARCYDKAAREAWGEFAATNFKDQRGLTCEETGSRC